MVVIALIVIYLPLTFFKTSSVNGNSGIARTPETANFDKDEKYILKVKDLEINQEEYSVKKGEKYIRLTPKEFEILYILASNKGRVYSTKTIYELVWKDAFLENDNSVLVHIRNLREKIGDKFKESRYIKTIWGVGYKKTRCK